MMDSTKIFLSSKPIEISEHVGYKLATFLISVLDQWDLNNRMILKEAGEQCHKTMIGFPILAKLVRDPITNEPIDFSGHEAYIEIDSNGAKSVRYGTEAIGSVINCWIEEREIDGYVGLQSCIMLQAKLWSDRFPEYYSVLDKLWSENNVSSSWELTVHEYEQTMRGKIIKAFTFLGNCILGSNVQGAVPDAGMLEYAEANSNEIDLASALSKDIISNQSKTKEQEDIVLNKKTEAAASIDSTVETEKKTIESELNNKSHQEEAALTDWDLRMKLQKACREKLDAWCWVDWLFPTINTIWVEKEDRDKETDFIKFVYEVDEDDNITLSEPEEVELTVSVAEINSTIAQKDEALLKANEKIVDLQAEVAILKPFKEACEKAETERIEAETAQKRTDLLDKLHKSQLFTAEEIESAEIATMIQNVDESGIKNIMADKFMASLEKEETTQKEQVETAEKKTALPKANIDNMEAESFSITGMLAILE